MGGLDAVQRVFKHPEGYCTRGERVRVVVELVVDAAGCPRHLRVLASPDETLSRAAVEAIRQSRFTPGQVDGSPVRVKMNIPFVLWTTC